MKTAGQLAYEDDISQTPTYNDGTPRRTWEALPDYARSTLERNPTPRPNGAKVLLHAVEY